MNSVIALSNVHLFCTPFEFLMNYKVGLKCLMIVRQALTISSFSGTFSSILILRMFVFEKYVHGGEYMIEMFACVHFMGNVPRVMHISNSRASSVTLDSFSHLRPCDVKVVHITHVLDHSCKTFGPTAYVQNSHLSTVLNQSFDSVLVPVISAKRSV